LHRPHWWNRLRKIHGRPSLRRTGAAIIDTDAFSHALTQPGTAGFNAIIQHFGPSYQQTDGTLDRGKLRS